MASQAIWVPGYVAVAEHVGGGGGGSDGPLKNYDGGPLGNVPQHDYQDIVGYRQGFGIRFRGKANQQVWFHFAIPTPVILENNRASLQRAFVMWRTDPNPFFPATLSSFHVWDGARAQLFQRDGLGLFGPFDGSSFQAGTDPKLVEGANMFTLEQPQVIYYGVGISVLIAFGSQNDDTDVVFSSAGADFITQAS